jgi:hypothetical protein
MKDDWTVSALGRRAGKAPAREAVLARNSDRKLLLMQRRTQFRTPLFGWPRRSGVGPDARFGHRILHPVALIAVIAFVLLDVFLVVRLTQDDPRTPTRQGASFDGSGSTPTSDRLGEQLGALDQTEIGTPIVAGKVVARLQGNDRSERKPGQDASATGTGAETVVSSSTSSTGTSSGSTSDGGSSSGGSGSGGSGSGGTDSGGSGSGGSGSGDSGGGGSGGGGSGGGDSGGTGTTGGGPGGGG